MDCVCGAIFHEEREEGKDLVDKVDDKSANDNEENGKPAAHDE